MKRLLLSLTLLFVPLAVFAQEADDSPASDEAAAAGALAAFGCGVIPCIIGLAIQIGLAVWVYKDAKKRGMENAVLLTVVTALTGLIGLLIYLLMRPKTTVQ